jgi:aryl-alcohol dehydrogenase-like predicted oxidoreductase
MKIIVEHCELAPGFSISRILTGLWQVADMERDGSPLSIKSAVTAMKAYADAGFTTFDMADHYGSAEVIAGVFLKEHGPNIQMLTKWVPKPGPVTFADVRAAVQLALDRMQTESLDLLQFHTWNYSDPIWLDCLYWLQELKNGGLIRHIGLTNVDTDHLRIAVQSGINIVSNQICFSLLDQRASQGMTKFCLKHGIKLLAFGVVAGGFLTERWLGKEEPQYEELSTWSQMKYKRFIDAAGGWDVFQDLLHTVDKAAKKHGVSMANIACRCILDEPSVGGIIIGTRLGQSEHIQDNLRLFRFSIDEKSRSDIRESSTKLLPIPGDCGDEYRKPPFLTASGDLSHHIESFPPPFETRNSPDNKTVFIKGSLWEDSNGKSLAVRQNDNIRISGITAGYGHRTIGGRDVLAKFHFVIDKIEGALYSLGCKIEDVKNVHITFKNEADSDALVLAHKKRFFGINPQITMTQSSLLEKGCLVEVNIEATAKK